MDEKLMTAAAVSEITGFHPRTVAAMGKRGEIPCAVVIGKHVRFKARSVREFFERGGLLRGAENPETANDAPSPCN